ncbi:hypothetical protein BYT27DRAFT_7186492 [Phlegmacium glaucopus]|nr:hypothetical protein BYT27DRAFT_7186492 [Phlegmacium glaucopus]
MPLKIAGESRFHQDFTKISTANFPMWDGILADDMNIYYHYDHQPPTSLQSPR